MEQSGYSPTHPTSHVQNPLGAFRATFEDKVLLSDIVFLRAWYPIQPRKYYNPVTNMLLPTAQKTAWEGMRLTRDVRKEKNLPIPQKGDSKYRVVEERPEQRKFNPLRVPRGLQKDLPFAVKPKEMKKRSSNKQLYEHRRAVVLEPEEKRIYTMMQQINTLRHEKEHKKKVKDAERRKVYEKKLERTESARAAKAKESKKEFYRKMGREENSKRGASDIKDAAFSSSKRARV